MIRRLAVANHAFGATWIAPRLSTSASGRLCLDDVEGAFAPRRFNQHGVRLFVVPFVRIADPFTFLFRQEAGLDPPSRLRIACLGLQGKRLDEHGPFGKRPTPAT